VPTDTNFLTRKLGPLPMWAWIGIGVAGAYWYISRQQANAAAAAASSSTSPLTSTAALQAANGTFGAGYAGSDLSSQLAGLVSMLGGGNAGTSATPAASPGNTTNITIGTVPVTTTSAAANTGSAPALPANPYPVGRTVAAGETITQAVWDPVAKTWIDVTSKGGAYTSAGLPLSGSAYGKGTGAWTLAGTPGQTFTEVLNGHSYTYSIK
jgi:hypothetical protein